MNNNSKESAREWFDMNVAKSLYDYLTMGVEIPEPIRKHFGFDRDYLLYERLNGMDYDEYVRRWREGGFPDVLDVNARLINAVERAFESICHHPPKLYIDRLDKELKELGRIAAWPASVHELCYVRSPFLAKYGIEKGSPADVICRQAEKAYRELDARCVNMTGRRPYADDFFHLLKEEQARMRQYAFHDGMSHRESCISFKSKAKGRKMKL